MVVLNFMLRVYEAVLLIRILISWVSPNSGHPFVQIVYRLTEPVLGPVRRALPTGGFGFDFSPVVVFIGIELLRGLLRGVFSL